MPNIQIKNVPEQTHSVFQQRAAKAHQSLQEYLLAKLIAEAGQPTVDEVMDTVATHAGGRLSLEDAVTAVRDERAGH